MSRDPAAKQGGLTVRPRKASEFTDHFFIYIKYRLTIYKEKKQSWGWAASDLETYGSVLRGGLRGTLRV
ncbi:hypothetical protein [Thalassobacillus hwangdonensis]|uniref:Uncharacterized protein n=1 Tax=Thalassobacillus hwangdonensis TaxID=546108 RepID=A0ABW3L4U0_9BACI